MNIKFFLFNESPEKNDLRFADSLRYLFSEYLKEDDSVGIYPSIKDAINSISMALKDSHILIFLASVDNYAEIKRKIAKTFNVEMQINEELQRKAFASLNRILPNSSSEEYAHCFAPVDSKFFALEDGLYSGFSAVSGNQTIICLPIDYGRTELLLTTQVIPYINSAYNISLSGSALREFNCNLLAESIQIYNDDFAIAKTNTSAYFLDYINNNDVIKNAIKDTSRSEKRENLSPEKHIINLSIMAKELASTKYGIAISNAYYSGTDSDSEKVIYLAVTNDLKSSVRELHSFAGEDVDYFLERASGDLCSLISDVIEGDVDPVEEETKSVSDGTKKYKIGIAIVSALIVVLLIGIITLFSMSSNSSRSDKISSENSVSTTDNSVDNKDKESTSSEDTEQTSDDDANSESENDSQDSDDETAFIAG